MIQWLAVWVTAIESDQSNVFAPIFSPMRYLMVVPVMKHHVIKGSQCEVKKAISKQEMMRRGGGNVGNPKNG